MKKDAVFVVALLLTAAVIFLGQRYLIPRSKEGPRFTRVPSSSQPQPAVASGRIRHPHQLHEVLIAVTARVYKKSGMSYPQVYITRGDGCTLVRLTHTPRRKSAP